jgi:plasmid stability protein
MIMAQVIIRNLEDRVVEVLRERARLHGHSLEQELRDILAKVARLTPAERLRRIDRIRAMTPKGVVQTDSTLLIRQDRDSR